ncbi:MAG: glutamine amidotransferase [Bacteroidia bacterium]|jgi:glutamine amidotransferase
MGNLGSVQNMFKYIGVKSQISSDIKEIKAAEKLLLPGVGSFDAAMQRLNDLGLSELLTQKVVQDKTPTLGICLGMQLLTNGSDEGKLAGLGWIDAYTHKFESEPGRKIPHMGWSQVHIKKESLLSKSISEESKFYFVHSYYVKVKDEENAMLTTKYGSTIFDSAIQNEHIFGAQFHPEKSHKHGMALLKSFADYQ